MSTQLQAIICQRCGRGFVLTQNYCDMLVRWGMKVVVPPLCPTCLLKVGPLPKQSGQVKWFDTSKHYGFILTEEGEEVFFHERQVCEDNGCPSKGQEVRFDLGRSSKGLEAMNVELGREEQTS